jgi:hypothetical protein
LRLASLPLLDWARPVTTTARPLRLVGRITPTLRLERNRLDPRNRERDKTRHPCPPSALRCRDDASRRDGTRRRVESARISAWDGRSPLGGEHLKNLHRLHNSSVKWPGFGWVRLKI